MMADKQMRGRLMEAVSAAGVAEDVPDERDGTARTEKRVDALQSWNRVQPVECRCTGGEIEAGRRQRRFLERRGDDLEAWMIEPLSQERCEPCIRLDRDQPIRAR